MRIIIDMQGAQSPASANRGVGNYTKSMVRAFIEYCNENSRLVDVYLLCNYQFRNEYFEIRNSFSDVISPWRILAWSQNAGDISGYSGSSTLRNVYQGMREWYISQLKPDVVWSTNLQEGWQDNCVTSVSEFYKNTHYITTLHDVTPLLFKERLLNPVIEPWYVDKLEQCKRSDLILTVSEFSKDKITELLDVKSDDVSVAYNGSSLSDVGSVSDFIPHGKYILYVGGYDEHKNVSLLVNGFAKLTLIENYKNYNLILVGNINHNLVDSYKSLMASQGANPENIKFLGFVSAAYLVSLYKSACLFVYPSIAEGFGLPVLDAMVLSCPVVAAKASSIPEILSDDRCLFDPYDVDDLLEKMLYQLDSKEIASELVVSNYGMAKKFSWRSSAEKIYKLIFDRFASSKSKECFDILSDRKFISLVKDISDSDLLLLAKNISENILLISNKTVHFDISSLIHADHATGIQRVVRAVIDCCVRLDFHGYNINVVYSYGGHEGFYNAKIESGSYAINPIEELSENLVDFNFGDIIVFLDLHPASAISKREVVKDLRSRGVKSVFVIYDILPTEFPQYFVPELSAEFAAMLETAANTDLIVAISEDVMCKVRNWINENVEESNPLIEYRYFHLGSDISASRPSKGLPKNAEDVLQNLRVSKSFLMVGTIEPRKGHSEVLDAFEVLWANDTNAVLVIVGKAGWCNEHFIERMRNHFELGRRLFWLEGISDEYLEKVYSNVHCLIAASYGEGFGLPLIEAAQHKIPIIARDIPVFREVAGDHAFYFDSKAPDGLAMAIQQWLALYQQDKYPRSDNMPWLTWEQSASNLKMIIMSELN